MPTELGDEAGSRFSQSRREWLAAQRDNRCIQVSGDSMAPILADGASVAYAKGEEDIAAARRQNGRDLG